MDQTTADQLADLQEGLYWIKMNADAHWEVASISPLNGMVFFVATDEFVDMSDLYEVGERIEPPVTTEPGKMKRIPIAAAKRIADDYGYDQVMIYARRVTSPAPTGEHVTTYGINRAHCSAAAKIGNWLKKHAGFYA